MNRSGSLARPLRLARSCGLTQRLRHCYSSRGICRYLFCLRRRGPVCGVAAFSVTRTSERVICAGRSRSLNGAPMKKKNWLGEAAMATCEACGAVEHGNITCRACRQHIRETTPGPHPFLDRLDAANIETIAPAGPEDVLEFMSRFGSDFAKDGAGARFNPWRGLAA